MWRTTNNLGNIRYSQSSKNFRGVIGNYEGFCFFDSKQNSVRALCILLTNYFKRYHLNTISSIIYRYAPSNENNTEGYIKFVKKYLSNTNLYYLCDREFDEYEFEELLPCLVDAMIYIETGKCLNDHSPELVDYLVNFISNKKLGYD